MLNKKQQVKRKDHALPRGRDLGVNREVSERSVRFQGKNDVRTGEQEQGMVSERNVRFQGNKDVRSREQEHRTVSKRTVRFWGKNDVHPGEQEHETVSERNVRFQGRTTYSLESKMTGRSASGRYGSGERTTYGEDRRTDWTAGSRSGQRAVCTVPGERQRRTCWRAGSRIGQRAECALQESFKVWDHVQTGQKTRNHSHPHSPLRHV
ncbi:hypothetical protein DFP72DRAFT_922385 [Ephemerocybe angulata]|uniref:Uncharacterized protein n=1 Tax=Ephemerocybe angulata TaxID=980116 RepID=A0A8H6LZC5_9AGAR|nr:hypothetical protein DFP72DRAFT_922385 [Tulosesus angulatus]